MRSTTFRTWGVVGLGVATACGSVLVACGGDDSGAVVTVDAGGGDSSTIDGGVDSASDAAHMDSATTDSATHDGATSDGETSDGDAAQAACDTPATGVFYVDPVNGSDTTNGSGTAGGTVAGRCAFKTLTFALTTVGAPTAATAIHVLGISTVSDGETFPLVVPANVSIDTMGGAVTVALPASSMTNAFTLAGAASGLTGLIIDGSAALGSTSGVIVNTGAAISTFVNGVEVKGFGGPGIQVQGSAAFTIDGGTSVHDNGAATSGTLKKAGLYVTGTAKVTASIATGGAEVSFASNGGEGVLVDSNAAIAFTGSPGTGGAGTLVMHDNATNGLTLSATPAIGGGGSTLTGVVLWHNTNEGGEIVAGATVTLRSCVALNNGDNGILISASAAVSLSNPLANIDLGSAHDGMNIVQDTTSGNSAAGICNGVSGTQLVPAALNAQGNTFDGHDCSLSASSAVTLTSNNCATGTGVDVGIKGTDATISTTYCTN